MLRLIICGINGRMGTHVYHSAMLSNHEITCGIDKQIVSNLDCPIYSDFDQIRHLADVIVDFSSPSVTSTLLNFAIETSLPIVIGTTGHSKSQEENILKASSVIPIFKSANTSLGVYHFIKLCRLATKLFDGFDVEIIEKHHKNKKDSPSGTVNLIFNEISKINSATMSKSQIHSLRGGTVIGDHTVSFFGRNESITLTHSAESKELFANGAIKACEFIVKQKNGLYNMEDLTNDLLCI